MRIQTKATNFSLTPAISDYLDKRLNQFQKFIDHADEALVMVELGRTTEHHRHGDIFRAEINLNVNGKLHRAIAETSDLYASIDQAKDEIVREIKESKQKHRTLVRQGATKVKDFIKKFYS